jgi:hypothetical protein
LRPIFALQQNIAMCQELSSALHGELNGGPS